MVNQRKAGVILSYISQIIHILSALIYTPIMLRILGQSEYGLYQLVHSTVAYLGVLSLGFTASYVRYYSQFKANNKSEEIPNLNGMYLSIFLIISFIATLAGIVMIFNIKACFSTGLTEAEYGIARILMAFMIFNLALAFPSSVFSCILAAHEEFFFNRLLNVLGNLLNPFLTLPVLLLGYGSIGMVVITSCITISRFIANVWFVHFRLHERFAFKNFDFSLLKDIWAFTFFIFLNQIINQINWSIGRFLLGRMLGTVAVAIYGVGAHFNTMYIMLSTSISSVFVPLVNKIVAETNDNHQLSLLFTRVGRFQFIILSLFLTGFLFFGKSFIEFWAGADYKESYYVALLLIGPVTVPLIQNLGIEIQRAKNKHQVRSIVYLGIGLCNIILTIPLIKLYGPIGAAIGTAVSFIIGHIFFMNWYYNYAIGIEIIEFWKSISGFLPSLFPPFLLGLIIVKFFRIDTPLALSVGALIYTLVFCLSMWFFGLNKYEKGIVLNGYEKLLKMVDKFR